MKHFRYTDTSDFTMRWSIFVDLWQYLSPYKTRMAFALGCLVASKMASVSLPIILKQVVDQLDKQDNTTLIAVPVALVILYGALRFANVAFGELRDTLFGRITESAMRVISVTALRHLHYLDISYHLERKMGGVARDIERGVSGISFLLRFLIFNIVPTLLEIGLIVGILLSQFSAWFAVVIIIAVLSYISFSVFTTEWRTQFIRETNESDSISQSRAVDSLLNYETVRYFGNEEWEVRQYNAALEKWQEAKRKNRLSLFFLNGGQAFIIALSMMSMLMLAAYEVANGNMTLGDFVMVNGFMMQLFIPLNFLGFVYREMKSALVNIEKLLGLLQVKAKVKDKQNAIQLDLQQGKFAFNSVNFSYNNERTIINNVNFTILPEQKVALVGQSGAGKSTIVKLLFRFYDVNEGTITADNQDIRDVSIASLRSTISIVPQEPVLFNGTIRDNIQYGNLNASEEDIEKSIQSAHLTSFINSLPKGLDTLVGERGLKVSGGEKQRIAIARALLKKPRLLIFDEATSSLDSVSENAISEALNEISQSISTLVIAHRLSTIVDADNIVVLKNGEVAEQGNHETLLMRHGEYHALWNSQMDK